MLSPDEFTVGTVGSATPGSLILPRNEREAAIIIGEVEGIPTAVFLSGQFRFRQFPSTDNRSWGGLIIPGARIEVDPTSVVGPRFGIPLGAIARTDTRLVIGSQPERSLGHLVSVTLQSGLAPTDGECACFSKWRVVIGQGQDKRILLKVDMEEVNAG